jgi:hypothetical protein
MTIVMGRIKTIPGVVFSLVGLIKMLKMVFHHFLELHGCGLLGMPIFF